MVQCLLLDKKYLLSKSTRIVPIIIKIIKSTNSFEIIIRKQKETDCVIKRKKENQAFENCCSICFHVYHNYIMILHLCPSRPRPVNHHFTVLSRNIVNEYRQLGAKISCCLRYGVEPTEILTAKMDGLTSQIWLGGPVVRIYIGFM